MTSENQGLIFRSFRSAELNPRLLRNNFFPLWLSLTKGCISPFDTQVCACSVSGRAEPLAQRPRAPPLLLAHDVCERWYQHAAPAGVLPKERPPAGSAAQHHDPHQAGAAPPGWVSHTGQTSKRTSHAEAYKILCTHVVRKRTWFVFESHHL